MYGTNQLSHLQLMSDQHDCLAGQLRLDTLLEDLPSYAHVQGAQRVV